MPLHPSSCGLFASECWPAVAVCGIMPVGPCCHGHCLETCRKFCQTMQTHSKGGGQSALQNLSCVLLILKRLTHMYMYTHFHSRGVRHAARMTFVHFCLELRTLCRHISHWYLSASLHPRSCMHMCLCHGIPALLCDMKGSLSDNSQAVCLTWSTQYNFLITGWPPGDTQYLTG